MASAFRLAIVSVLLAFMLVSARITDFAYVLALGLMQTIRLPNVTELISTVGVALV